MAEKKNTDFSNQANEILKIAEAKGVQTNFFFVTTFKRYLVQIKILDDLNETIKNEGLLVKKEYVKNRKNLYSNPAVAEYNRTTDSANKTVATLIKIIRGFNKSDDETETDDPLLKIINGDDEDGQ